MLNRRRFVQTASLGALALLQAACASVYAQEEPNNEMWQSSESDSDVEVAADRLSVLEWQPADGLFPFDGLTVADVSTVAVTWDLIGSYELDADELASLVDMLVALEAPALDEERGVHLKKAAFELAMADGSVCSIELGTTTGEPYGYVDTGEAYIAMEAAYLLINGVEHNMYVDDVATFAEMYSACTEKLQSGLPEFVYPFANFDAANLENVTIEQQYTLSMVELNAEQIEGLIESLSGLKLASATAIEPELMFGGCTYLLRLAYAGGKTNQVYLSDYCADFQIDWFYAEIVDESCNDALDYCADLF